ncbi:MAG: endolytic transglycosylase MltG [Hyphomonadaceae bacterium]
MAAAEAARRQKHPKPAHMSGSSRGAQRSPKKKKNVWSWLNTVFSALITLGVVGLAIILAFVAESTRGGPNETEGAIVVAPRGASVTSIGRILEEEGHIRSALVFRVATLVYGAGKPLQAGEYEIPARASPRAIIDMMANGRAVLHGITIPEGRTSAAVIQILAESDVLTGDVPAVPPEGSILPETYSVERGMDRTVLLRRMMEARDEALREIWAQRASNLPISTPEEAVILASIVEKETGVASERPRVASVFTNRLRRGMPMQSDPTIIYGVCRMFPDRCRDGRLINERTGAVRTIRQSEIALDTGYNTYRIPRLPPTAIANPGRDALEAVVNPPRTNDLFFVADGTGGHAFASTVAEHERNVRRWREIERGLLAAERP